MEAEIYQAYVKILEEELVPAMGCTEPIAIAYAASLAREALGTLPDKVRLVVSGNIIKNVKSVIVPHTGGRRGLRTAVAAGICFGNAKRQLEVIADVSAEQLMELDRYMGAVQIEIGNSSARSPFDIQVTVYAGEEEAFVRIIGSHTNVVLISRNGRAIYEKSYSDEMVVTPPNRQLLSVEKIVQFADEVRMQDVQGLLRQQVNYNMTIAEAGLTGEYGANIGKVLLSAYGNSLQNRAKAWTAAGSDARMSGCELPVIINSGSGNQGMTSSIPIVIYARELNVSEDMMLRALVISNLVTIHLKTGIGSLSAYCGATSAGAGAGAGVCYLFGGRYQEIAHTIVNALAINSGMMCDGAKASCAAKISSAVEAGLLGMQMNLHDREFRSGDGIVIKGVENTIRAVSSVARDGMRGTDAEIIRIMIQNE